MALKACLDCGTLSPATRCPPCARARDNTRYARRGTRQQRGLDTEYDRNRAIILASATVCAICGRPGTPTDPLTAGHITDRQHGGTNALTNLRAEHASYNYSQGRPCRGGGAGRQGGGPPSR